MRHLLIATLLFTATFTPSFAAGFKTEPGPILLHVTESDSARTFSLGFYLDNNQAPLGLFFEDYNNPGEAGIQRFPLQILNTPQVFYQKRGYDVAKLSFTNSILTVLFKKDVRLGDDTWIKREFLVNGSVNQQCVIIDTDSQLGIQGVELVIHYSRVLGINVATGVDSIKGIPASKPKHRRRVRP